MLLTEGVRLGFTRKVEGGSSLEGGLPPQLANSQASIRTVSIANFLQRCFMIFLLKLEDTSLEACGGAG